MPILLASLIILAPLYVWRFTIGGALPVNFLMLANFVVIGAGVVQIFRQWRRNPDQVVKQWRRGLKSLGIPLMICICLFAIASLISLFAFGVNAEKVGQWAVLYLQPLAIFALVRYYKEESVEGEATERWSHFFTAAYIIIGLAGILALVQYFTLLALPPMWQGNANEPKRAIAFFAHANAYGLYVTPLLAWLIPDAVKRFRAGSRLWPLLWVCGGAGMFLSLSRGAWLGFFAAAAVFAILSANKKLIIGFALAALVLAGVVAAVPNLRYRVLLPFHGEKSAVARISLWHTAGLEIKDNPILGKGINGFSDNWTKYNADAGLDHYNFPHNIFLNFWVDLGLLGLISMLGILILSAIKGFLNRKNLFAFGMLLFIVALVVHGLIDIPYLKNDLALVFWIVLGLGL
jgi:O-antigen ligase